MKEYSIFITNKNCKEYSLTNYYNIFDVKNALYNMIKFEEEKNHLYYVNNDFFDNKYTLPICNKIFTVKSREVTQWQKFSDKIYSNSLDNIFYL